MSWKALVREVTPPLLWNLARRVAGKDSSFPSGNVSGAQNLPEFEWIDRTRDDHPLGYVGSGMVDAPIRHFPELLRRIQGPEPFGCVPGELTSDSISFWHQQVYPFAYALARSLPAAGPLSILDWGGGLGLYSHLASRLYPEREWDYHVHELPEFAARGPEFTPQVRFHSRSEEWRDDRFGLVIASGSLQYVPDWRVSLRELANVTGRWLYLARTPVTLSGTESRVVLHRPRSYGYETDVLFHVLSRSQLLEELSPRGFSLVREFIGAEEILVHPDQSRVPFRGYLFEKV